MLRNADWQLVAECSAQLIGHIVKTLEDETDGLPLNDSNYQSTLRNITKQPRCDIDDVDYHIGRFVLGFL